MASWPPHENWRKSQSGIVSIVPDLQNLIFKQAFNHS